MAIIEKFSLRTSLCYEQDEVIIANTEQNVSCRKMDYDSQHIWNPQSCHLESLKVHLISFSSSFPCHTPTPLAIYSYLFCTFPYYFLTT